MILRRLNDQGIERFESFLDAVAVNAHEPVPRGLLEDSTFSDQLGPVIRVEQADFKNHFDISKHLYESFLESPGLHDIERDRGLWAWLSLFYFEKLCPVARDGSRKPGERARWILNVTSRRYYRHLLAGPWLVFRLHAADPERAMALLCSPMHQLSDVYLELVDNQKLISVPSVVEAVTKLYYDPQTASLKRRTGRDSPGGARRFGEIMEQFNCTWDFHSLNSDQIIGFLPQEFDPFKA